MVLGRLGRTENSPSKSVCSILPIAICGPGSYGAPAFILSFAALFGFPPRRGLRFAPRLRCTGPRMVRPCLHPVGRAQLLEQYSTTLSCSAPPASIIGSELPRARLRPFALPRAYRAPIFPLPCLAGEPVRGGGEG